MIEFEFKFEFTALFKISLKQSFGSEKGRLSYLQCFHARNVTRICLGGGHQSLTCLSLDFPIELV